MMALQYGRGSMKITLTHPCPILPLNFKMLECRMMHSKLWFSGGCFLGVEEWCIRGNDFLGYFWGYNLYFWRMEFWGIVFLSSSSPGNHVPLMLCFARYHGSLFRWVQDILSILSGLNRRKRFDQCFKHMFWIRMGDRISLAFGFDQKTVSGSC